MSARFHLQILCGLIVASSTTWCLAIDVTAVVAAGDATTLANQLVDPLAPVTVDAASFNIDTAGGGTAASNLRSIGTFVNGQATGQLPAANQPATGGPISYSGGIGISSGVCLSTGVVTDADVDGANATTGSGVGVEGPNNGFALTEYFETSDSLNAGELSFRTDTPIDDDFKGQVVSVQPTVEGDAAVLQYEITLAEPGFLRISFVFASDEAPFHIFQGIGNVNDSMAVFIRQESCPNPQFSNIAVLKTPDQEDEPLSLRGLIDIDEPLFFRNQVAPAPTTDLIGGGVLGNFQSSLHGYDEDGSGFNEPADGVAYYNHEFAGFSKVLTRETPKALTPGTYTIKIVVQDVFDRNVDSAVFVQEGSLRLFEIAKGDYNLDGTVDAADYAVWRDNYGANPATYDQGNGNGDCTVNLADYTVWRDHLGATGNKDIRSDFDRDGDVDLGDFWFLNQFYGLGGGASRFEGDADGDGDVDDDDVDIFISEWGITSSMTTMIATTGGVIAGAYQEIQSLIAGKPGKVIESAIAAGSLLLKEQVPENPDVNNDGVIDEQDFAVLDQLMGIE